MKPVIPATPADLGSDYVHEFDDGHGHDLGHDVDLGRDRGPGFDRDVDSGRAQDDADDDGTAPLLHRRSDGTSGRPYLSALAVFGSLKLLGFGVFMLLLNSAGDFRNRYPRFGGGAHPWDVLATWDGWWYQQIAENGYNPQLVTNTNGGIDQNSAAFFPLYPGLMRVVSDLTGLGSYGAGMLVSVVASFVAAAGIYAVVVQLRGHRTALCAAGLCAVWPGSGAEWAVYSDSLFVAIAAWTCHAVMTRRWIAAGFLCLAAGLSRPSSIPLIAAVGLAALVAAWRREDGILRPLATMVLAPLGLVGYIVWVGVKAGNIKAFFILESDAWDHYVDWGKQSFHAIGAILVGHTDYDYANTAVDVISLGVVIMALILLAVLITQRPPLVLTVLAALTTVMTLMSHQIFSDISRYMLPAFPLMIPAAAALARVKISARVTFFVVTALASGSYAGYMLFELAVP